MGLGELTPTDTDEGSSAGKSTYVSFKNPRAQEIGEKEEHRHKQEYYDSVQELRSMLKQDINVPFGEFARAVVAAEKDDDDEPLRELFNTITS